MKIDEHIFLGFLIGVLVALNYGASLVTYMPIIVVVTAFLVLRRLGTK